MATVTLKGVDPRIDGEYDFEFALTNRDLHDIKRIAGLRVGELEEALEAMDNDLVVALAHIVLRRAGKDVLLDVLWDAPLGAITYDGGDEDALPPAQTLSGSSGETDSASESSGVDSSSDGDGHQETSPVAIGSQVSATGVLSAQVISPN